MFEALEPIAHVLFATLNNAHWEQILGHTGHRTMRRDPTRASEILTDISVGVVLDKWVSLHLVLCPPPLSSRSLPTNLVLYLCCLLVP